MTDLDLRDAFESSFGPEPPLPSPDSTVRAGRSALMRRNLAITGTTVAVAAVALLGATQLGGDPTAAPGPVGKPTPTPTVSEQQRLTDATDVDSSWRADCGHAGQPGCARYRATSAPVGIDATGELVRVADDVQISQRADDVTPPAGGVRMVVEVITPASIHPTWWVLTRTPGGTRVQSAEPARIDFETFSDAANDDRTAPGQAPLVTSRAIVGD
jgi:hypothetical protein